VFVKAIKVDIGGELTLASAGAPIGVLPVKALFFGIFTPAVRSASTSCWAAYRGGLAWK
jgi:hypothetical protein